VGVGFKNDSFGRLVGAEAKGAGREEATRFFLGDADVPSFEERSVAKGWFEFVSRE
jgi:hypothetical protein